MTTARRRTTTALAAVVVGVLACLPLLVLAAPAEASSYRYWTYWWGSGSGKTGTGWTFAQVGPAGHRVNDTWVLGWRFSTSTSTNGGAKPRQSSDFASLCPSLDAPVPGKDRVALVLDYGTTADAPPGQRPPSTSTARVECLTLPSSPHQTGAAVLNEAGVAVRSEGGLLCALDGYPVGECAPVVPDPAPTPTAGGGTSKPTPSPTRSTRPPASTAPATAGPTASESSRTPSTTGASALPTTDASPSAPPSTSDASVAADSTDESVATSDEPTLAAAAGAPSTEQGSTGPIGVVVAGALVATLAGSAWWTTRRGRRA